MGGGALAKTFFQGPYRVVTVLRKEGGTINTWVIQKIGSRARQVVNGRDLKLGHSIELDQRLSELETTTTASGGSSSDDHQFVLGILRARGRAEEREYLVQFGPDRNGMAACHAGKSGRDPRVCTESRYRGHSAYRIGSLRTWRRLCGHTPCLNRSADLP